MNCGGVIVFTERMDALRSCAKYSCLKLARLARKGYLSLNHKHLTHKHTNGSSGITKYPDELQEVI